VNKSIKNRIARATACNRELNKKIICIKRSWDEVNSILNKPNKRKRKHKPYK
jgi:hypothetical protein